MRLALTTLLLFAMIGGPHPGFATPPPRGMGEAPVTIAQVPLITRISMIQGTRLKVTGPSPILMGVGVPDEGGVGA